MGYHGLKVLRGGLAAAWAPASHQLPTGCSPLDGLATPLQSPALFNPSSPSPHTITTQSQHPSDPLKVGAPQASHHRNGQCQLAGGCSRQMCHLQHRLHKQHFLLLCHRSWDAAVGGWSASPCAAPQHQQRPSMHHCILTTPSPTNPMRPFLPYDRPIHHCPV